MKHYSKLLDQYIDMYETKDLPTLITTELLNNGTVYRKKRKYTKEFCTLDIETTTFYSYENVAGEEIKTPIFAHPYTLQMMIGDKFYFSRYAKDIRDFIMLCDGLNAIVPVFIHFIRFEYNNLFQYISDLIDESSTLYKNNDYPLILRCGNVEFRCTFELSHTSLAKMSKSIGLEKGGDFDYDILRDSETPLTNDEIEYCFRDVYNLRQWILNECRKYRNHKDEIKKLINPYDTSKTREKYPAQLPYTSTGYVREDMKQVFSSTIHGKEMLEETELDVETYKLVYETFRGGDTQARIENIGITFHNLKHNDLVSAYPFVMIAMKYPIGRWRRVEDNLNSEFKRLIACKDMAIIAKIQLVNVRLKDGQNGYISKHKCKTTKEAYFVNNRLINADVVELNICDVDFKILKNTYDSDGMRVLELIYQRKYYLPNPICKLLLYYFNNKTIYKYSTNEEELESYAFAKALLNSMFGLSATNLLRDEYYLTPTGYTSKRIGELQKQKVLPYQWCVYITAYVRSIINYFKCKLGEDFVYCDTDSIFYRDSPAIRLLIEIYNKSVIEKLEKRMTEIGVNREMMFPKDPKKGIPQVLGLFLEEDDCDRFITLGSKRYVLETNGRINATISGLSNTKFIDGKMGDIIEYLRDGHEDIFESFEYLVKNPRHTILIPSHVTGRKITKISREVHKYVFEGREILNNSSMIMYNIPIDFGLEGSIREKMLHFLTKRD